MADTKQTEELANNIWVKLGAGSKSVTFSPWRQSIVYCYSTSQPDGSTLGHSLDVGATVTGTPDDGQSVWVKGDGAVLAYTEVG